MPSAATRRRHFGGALPGRSLDRPGGAVEPDMTFPTRTENAVSETLALCRWRGIVLTVHDGQLLMHDPNQRADCHLRARLREFRAAIIHRLRPERASAKGAP